MAAAIAVILVLTVAGAVLLWPNTTPRHAPSQLRDLTGGAPDLVDATIGRAGQGPCPDPTGAGPSPAACDQLDIVLTGRPAPGNQIHLDVPVDPTRPAYEPGDRIRLAPTVDTSGQPTYYIVDFQRAAPLGWIAALTAVMVVAVARWRGLAALAGLVLTYLVIVRFTLPSLLDGHSPVAVALTTGAALMVGLLYLAHGVSARTTVALLGTLASLALTAALGAAAIDLAHITGLGSDEDVTLKAFAGELSLPGLVLASVIIGSLGLINDMTVTQAAAVWEVSDAAPDTPVRRLYRTGMRVGRDHIASSVYTLALAYAGAALPTLLLFTLADRASADVATSELVATEIVRTAAGTVGLVASVPFTTAIAALVVSRRRPADAGTDAASPDTDGAAVTGRARHPGSGSAASSPSDADGAVAAGHPADTQPLTYRASPGRS
ncbi:YibE/F family protein [Candidatus Protofrankia datiscae]|uniref:YibE/F family protein n=3 Tax=Protofrankia TaxID=2994361 RepID=F8AW03_9ACTN|nr:YibE/F family protein [Candidatus Protofrankia datiscae]AEH09324.1 YibE/F family protein [Candidatus Protofrankia datiscae]